MDRWNNRIAVVTGASSGIGEAIVVELVKHGLIVVGLARREEKLQVLSNRLNSRKKVFHNLKCDVRNEEDITNAFKWIQTSLGGVSVLVNNAGLLQRFTLLDTNAEEMKNMFETNVCGLTLCAREGMRSMITNKIDDGHIININSLLGHTMPDSSPTISDFIPYTSIKRAVTVITEGLRRELRDRNTGIKVTSLSPGLVETEMTQNFTDELSRSRLKPLQATDIANACVWILQTPPNVLVREMIVTPVGE